ncbi:MAG: type II toxin-antitoxin system YafQ family toxin [Bacteroidaceae bacterium]|nr:type II toxin-antitoxin system YafQ family toxin [Bacteroidaceae bacterium]
MKEVFTTTQYRRDIKKFRHKEALLRELNTVVDKLRRNEPLDVKNKKHSLHGEYEGCLECHVGNDFLLVWVEDDNILLVRIGSHSELFGR